MWVAWGEEGELPDAGLLIHCFDGHEAKDTPWTPTSAKLYSYTPCTKCMPHVSWDLSTSLIFKEQTTALSGAPNPKGHAPVDYLFGGGCGGGLVFRPRENRVQCGNAQDCGGYCHEMCPDTEGVPDKAHGPTCSSSWAPKDIHVYLERETRERRGGAYRNNVYNEFIIVNHAAARTLKIDPHAADLVFASRRGHRMGCSGTGGCRTRSTPSSWATWARAARSTRRPRTRAFSSITG